MSGEWLEWRVDRDAGTACPAYPLRSLLATATAHCLTMPQYVISAVSSHFSQSMAAAQPEPAAVMAWR